METMLASGAQARPAFELWAELGPEFDSNALRLNDNDVGDEGNPLEPIAAPLMRATLGASLMFSGRAHQLHLSYGGGGKLYLDRGDARAADELVQRGALTWAWRFARRLKLSLTGTYYDMFQREVPTLPTYVQRDFRTGTGVARFAAIALGGHTNLSAHLGYQGLQYKPQEDNLSFNALLGGLAARYVLSRGPAAAPVDWSLGALYVMALRLYEGQALDDQGLPQPDVRHRDMTHEARAELRRVSNADLALWYAFEYNASNSFGETFGRHVIGLRFTTPVIWDIYLTADGIYRISSFSDPLIAESAQQRRRFLEDENRSRVGVSLSRELSQRWSLGLRYNLYINEATSFGQDDDQPDDVSDTERAPGYLRQTVMLVVRFEYANTD